MTPSVRNFQKEIIPVLLDSLDRRAKAKATLKN